MIILYKINIPKQIAQVIFLSNCITNSLSNEEWLEKINIINVTFPGLYNFNSKI